MKKEVVKVLNILLLSLCLLIFKVPNLNAASGSITVKSNKSTAVIGSTVDVTVTVSSSSALGAWEYRLNYDSSKLTLINNEKTQIADYGNGSKKSASYTYRFKVSSSGSSTVSVSNTDGVLWTEEKISFTQGSVRIKGITQAELEASYSKNNNLSSIGVAGYTLDQEFNKDTLEYTVTIPNNVEKITLEGAVEDKKASVTGLGEFEVSEGENKFDIIVTAENGSQKTYVIKVNVQDENPIEVIIDGLTYTVVKRSQTLTPPSTYTETTQMINGIEVPAFKSEITNYVLVGLKTKDGTPNLYIYNEENNSYTLYKEVKTEGIIIFPTTAKQAPLNYKKVKITINDEEVEAYVYDNKKKGIIEKLDASENLMDGFYLIYGVNIETGDEGFYQYDSKLNTLSRYNANIIENLTKENKNYLIIIIVLAVETIILVFILLIVFIRRNKNKKRKSKKLDFSELENETKTEDKQKEKEHKKKEKNDEKNEVK